MTHYVICALQMEGFHCWPEADGELAYLKNSHRHIFFITAEFPVRNANREIEIISQQNAIISQSPLSKILPISNRLSWILAGNYYFRQILPKNG